MLKQARRQGASAVRDGSAVGLAARGIRHSFMQESNVVDALDDVDLEIHPGEFVALVGPSGCGKTTLLNMFAGLLGPERGEILLDQEPRFPRAGEISYMLAADALLPWKTARQNVEMALRVRGISSAEAKTHSVEWLSRVGLGNATEVNVQRLSHGMRQRVAIARTLVQNPRAILMDEPFAALDAQTRIVVQEQFLKLWESNPTTVVLVTHDLAEAILLCDRVVLLSRGPGRIVADISVGIDRPRRPERDRTNATFVRQYDDLWKRLRAEFGPRDDV